METSNQPARSTWNLTQMAFDEMRLLYAAFSRNPFDGFSLLRDYPPVTESLKSDYARFERLKDNPCEEPSTVFILDLERIPAELVLNPSHEVRIWLYRSRIKSVLQKYRTDLRVELSTLTNDVRSTVLVEYRKSLEKLSIQLFEFDGTTADSFPELANDTTANWPELYTDLNNYVSLVRETIETYKVEIGIWLKQTPPTSTPKGKNPTQSALAMFYFFGQHTGEIAEFKTGEMEREYERAVKPYGLSAKSFQQHYNQLRKRENRKHPGIQKAFLEAIKLLQNYPKALSMATDELNTAKIGKPLT